jgi:hypothetical protein
MRNLPPGRHPLRSGSSPCVILTDQDRGFQMPTADPRPGGTCQCSFARAQSATSADRPTRGSSNRHR